MSYLDPLRLHFTGRFLAAPPTANNDPMHYNLATFREEFRERGPGATKGWWNPGGNADWRFLGCTVTAAYVSDGTPVPADDAVLTLAVADSDERVAAKMCDLDTEQQLVSEIWGLEVRLVDPSGHTVLRGRVESAAFMDIWDRAPEVRGDGLAGVWYQSVLTDLDWADVSASPFLTALATASAQNGLLSIRFNIDLYDMDFKSATFTQGRIAGTIGPASTDEPRHFVAGRQLMAAQANGGNFFKPAAGVNFCVARVDAANHKVLLDLGNALTVKPTGEFHDVGRLTLQCVPPGGSPLAIDDVPYLASNWYRNTAGIVALPAGRALTDAELALIAGNPLVITLTAPGQPATVAVSEATSGEFVRADRYVYRLDAGDHATVDLFATRFGAPAPAAAVTLALDPSQLQAGPNDPPVGTPETALTFPATVTADARGRASFTILATDPGNPRGFIDGQVYGIRPLAANAAASDVQNPWTFVSVLLWNAFMPDSPATWHGSMQPIFQLYRNLYPAMDRFLDLSKYEDICAHRGLLVLAFSLDVANPNSMPVTRELSNAKRAAILKWLDKTGPDGKPLLGVPAAAPMSAAVETTQRALGARLADVVRGGKEAAIARRVISQRRAAGRPEQP
jgi:hypothetical protein